MTRKGWLLAAALLVGGTPAVASAQLTTLFCQVTGGTVLTANATGYTIFGGVGTNTSSAAGTITCPAVNTLQTIISYRVLAQIGYGNGPFGTTSGTTTTQTLTLFGGPLNGASATGTASGGASVTPPGPPPFQIGSTLSGGTSYASFQVIVDSRITQGGPVGSTNGIVAIQYEVAPEPGTYALMAAGLAGMGLVARRRRRA